MISFKPLQVWEQRSLEEKIFAVIGGNLFKQLVAARETRNNSSGMWRIVAGPIGIAGPATPGPNTRKLVERR